MEGRVYILVASVGIGGTITGAAFVEVKVTARTKNRVRRFRLMKKQ
ncbi:MAG: hypothetical protein LBB98_14625 [Treponema sp.]|jgi:cysteine synthase|nr:hypothetical protein [Treponema sp.]